MTSLEHWTQRGHMRRLRYVCAFRRRPDCDPYGEAPLDGIEQKHVLALHRSLERKPATADNTVKSVRLLFNWLRKEKHYRGENPAVGIQWLWDSEGHETADIEHLQKLEKRWAVGTPERACLALMFYAGVRVSDAYQLGPFNLKNGKCELHWTEAKGSQSRAISDARPTPKRRKLEVHPELRRVLDATPVIDGRFVYSATKQAPYATKQELGRAFKLWCKKAGVPAEITAHSIRKAAAARMFENGATKAELCAIFGWEIGSPMAAWYPKHYSKQCAQTTGLARLPVLRRA